MENATDKQIQEWKKKHGEIFLVEVEDKKAYLKAPDRKTLSAASAIGAKDPIKFNETILKNCWIEGDKELLEDDKYFLAVGQQIDKLIEVKEASIKKL